MTSLVVALVGGPMYDGLYAGLEALGASVGIDDIEIVVHADHPTLNTEVARRLGAGERIDVISTHGKYAPSQAAWLRPLDDVIDPAVVDAQSEGAVALCRGMAGELLCVPRNVDVRVMWRRVDLVPEAPDTWDDVLAMGRAGRRMAVPGRESGLFGTFFELVVGTGARLLDDAGRLVIDAGAATTALHTLSALTAGMDGIEGWHYDDVDAALGDGRAALGAAWPGATAGLRASVHGDVLRPSAYPAGPTRRVTYAGCHAWAIPRAAAEPAAAAALIGALCGAASARREAASGAVTAHEAVAAEAKGTDAIDQARIDLVRAAIAEQMITYPPHPRFAGFEDGGWRLVASTIFEHAPLEGFVERLGALAQATLEATP